MFENFTFVVCVASMMASSLLRSTSDFLASGVDKCLSQLYDCADLQTPDSSCSSVSDSSRLSYNTRAAFERRYFFSNIDRSENVKKFLTLNVLFFWPKVSWCLTSLFSTNIWLYQG